MRTVGEIVKEGLVALRKARGVQSKDLETRITPEFAELIGTTMDTGTALRAKVVAYLDELMTGLPEPLVRVARSALNIPPAADGNTLNQRLTALAAEFFFDTRTARRRMDEAFERMVSNADRGQVPPPGAGHGGTGWYVDAFEAVLRLDLASPEAVERRTIVATAESLDKIVTSMDVPKNPSNGTAPVGVAPEMMFGGLIAATGQGSSTNFSTEITLPRALHRGERHTYGLIQRIPPGQRMETRYVYVPYRQCRFFKVVVRFHPDRVPSEIWRHDGVPHSAVHDDPVPGTELVPDRANEVSAQFRELINGCAYGIQWR
ncbi:hypothetical protein [Kibdelosporangium phytohabitans]|uniref:Uncharacterized protein n=1 Tax=Kibdelosporangium phytohabitans TaxID=860235 RepID=A0A0N9I2I3_9PSEU|nr:hypothetical protein [Kibdelosporangium phytohabitans]ALG10246.1 hypothetical protein AOZ06_28135 [Kibdelosporangium phytohabitans]MBE1461272.1 hypothetical protein [Kibdelosporangium phytohabitans]